MTKLLTILLVLVAGTHLGVCAAGEGEFYDPVTRQIEGWTVAIDPQLLSPENKETGEESLKALANHLQRIRYIVPADRLEQLQQLRIWIDWKHKLGNMQYHPDRGWLLANNHDPRLVKHVHIPRAKQLLDPGNGPNTPTWCCMN